MSADSFIYNSTGLTTDYVSRRGSQTTEFDSETSFSQALFKTTGKIHGGLSDRTYFKTFLSKVPNLRRLLYEFWECGDVIILPVVQLVFYQIPFTGGSVINL